MAIYKGSFSLLPANAGVILRNSLILPTLISAPRECGGDPDWDYATRIQSDCSPRMRG